MQISHFSLSVICLRFCLSSHLPLGWSYHSAALKVRESGPDNGLSKRTSAESFTLPKGLGAWTWQSQMDVLYDCCLIILLWLLLLFPPETEDSSPLNRNEWQNISSQSPCMQCRSISSTAKNWPYATIVNLGAGMRNLCRVNEFKK